MTESSEIENDDVPARSHAKHAQSVPAYVEKARKTRRKLTVAIAVLLGVLLVGAIGVAVFVASRNGTLTDTLESRLTQVSQIASNNEQDSQDKAAENVPSIAKLVGMKADDVAGALGEDAKVASDETKDSEEDPVKRVIKLEFNEGASSSASATTIVVNANSEGNVTSASFQAPVSSLGFNAMSFEDAVNNERIVEKVMKGTGVEVVSDGVVLPEDKSQWTTFSDNGSTAKEEYEFSGEADGKKWTARLLYDYTISAVTGNLSDTIRTIYVTISG